MVKVIIALSTFCLTYQKSLKDVYTSKFLIFLKPLRLSKYQCGFRIGHGAQHCLTALLEKWQESIDRELEFGILLTDLSRAFDCLPHNLFVAKLLAYGFDDKALRFIYDYLRHRKQRTKIADSYSSWQEILYGIRQGSILGPLLFNADCVTFLLP